MTMLSIFYFPMINVTFPKMTKIIKSKSQLIAPSLYLLYMSTLHVSKNDFLVGKRVSNQRTKYKRLLKGIPSSIALDHSWRISPLFGASLTMCMKFLFHS